MKTNLEQKRIYTFLAITFGLAWITSLVIYLTGGLQNSPVLIPNTPVTLALVLLAVVVMWSPAIGNILTRIITKEGWQHTYLRPHFKKGWPYWLAAWFLPGILTVIGMGVFFLLSPTYFDPSLGKLKEMLEASAPGIEINVWVIAAVQTVQAMLIAPIFNSLATFGEEFGWRGYLQPKLMPLGGRKAMLLMGLIWGVWHWPVILMGHNYGLDYPGAPFLGPLAMVWFCLVIGIFLGWVTLKSRSVWPAVIGHAAINGIAGIGVIFIQGNPNPILGPMPVGIIGGIGFTIVALLIFITPNGLVESEPVNEKTTPEAPLAVESASLSG
ncbi:MAG: CPBP family intramembrane metalloprotease [Anaerolineae bacterium]|nr:CPBP family intramembrane metalloprotease [Anaerolineae bacterium]